MATVLDEQLSREWMERLPAAFRELDTEGQLFGYLRTLGDYAGGLSLVIGVLEGSGYIRPIQLTNGSWLTLGDVLLVTDAVIDPTSRAAVLPLDSPVTVLDPLDPGVLLATSGDWLLADVQTIPTEWIGWVAQVLAVSLTPVPAEQWRAWIEDEASRLTGTLEALRRAVSWHTLTSIPFTVERASQWEVVATVQEEAITTSVEALQAALDALAPAGVGVTVSLI